MNKLAVAKEIREILLASEEVSALVGKKIFPIVATGKTEGDFIICQRDGYKQDYTKMGVVRQIPTVFVNVVSDDYDRSIQLASLIYESLEGNFTDPDMTIHLEDSTEDYSEGKYFQVLQFSVE